MSENTERRRARFHGKSVTPYIPPLDRRGVIFDGVWCFRLGAACWYALTGKRGLKSAHLGAKMSRKSGRNEPKGEKVCLEI